MTLLRLLFHTVTTVEHLNKGRVGTSTDVHYLEVVLYWWVLAKNLQCSKNAFPSVVGIKLKLGELAELDYYSYCSRLLPLPKSLQCMIYKHPMKLGGGLRKSASMGCEHISELFPHEPSPPVTYWRCFSIGNCWLVCSAHPLSTLRRLSTI